MSGIKSFFPVDKQRTSPQKLKQSSGAKEMAELLDSSDEDDIVIGSRQVTTTTKARNSSQLSSSTKPVTSRVSSEPQSQFNAMRKVDPVKQDAAEQRHQRVPPAAQVVSTPLSAAEVLASIPSVELPSVDSGAKPNFRQIMERQSSSQQDSGTQIEAAPNCLLGLTFVVTGQLPSLGREEIQRLIKQYGGHVTSSLSGKTSALVLGEDAGPSKIQKARSLHLKVIDEAGFIQLLKSMPADGGSGRGAELARAKRAREEKEVAEEVKRIRGDQPKSASKSTDADSRRAGVKEGSELWTTKYAPHQMSDIIGNNAAVQKLSKWLQHWNAARSGGYNGDGSEFRAAILSGPPGIGKTTAAHLLGGLQGYQVVEYNASDTRSKSLLNAHVSQTLSNTSLTFQNKTKKLLVIMDEVDGMSAGDRGGVGAMAALARTTNVPLILICNERSLPKMRPFDRVTFDIPFRRPDAAQVRHRIMSIAAAEGLKLDSAVIEQLVAATRSDIRQILNLLETYRTTQSSMTYQGSRQFSSSWNKEVVLKPFDITARLLSRGSQMSMSTNERIELYFNDYDFAPLMLQENYLVTSPNLAATASAAESISEGDLVDRLIHGSQQQWSLMPLHAVLSCVRPAFAAAGQARGRFNFTSYLGNNSKSMKYRRLLAEVRSHLRLRVAADASDLRLEYQPILAQLLLSPLLKSGADAIPDVIAFMDNYYLTKEDWDVIMELGVGPNNSEQLAKKVPTTVKTAFTRKYNGMSHPLPFMKSIDSKAAATTGRKQEVPDLDDVIADDVEVDDDVGVNDENELETAMKNDKYIKSKPKPRAATKAASKSKASKTASTTKGGRVSKKK